MKLYLASSFRLTERVQVYCRFLENAGHEVTVKWWDITRDGYNIQEKKRDTNHPERFYSDPLCKVIFDRDFNGVKNADALVFIADDEPTAYNGANVELGIALGDGKTCYSLGRLDNSALYYPVTRCKDVVDLIRKLDSASPSRAPAPEKLVHGLALRNLIRATAKEKSSSSTETEEARTNG